MRHSTFSLIAAAPLPASSSSESEGRPAGRCRARRGAVSGAAEAGMNSWTAAVS